MKVLHVFTLAETAEAFFDGQFAYLTDGGQTIHLASSTEPNANFTRRNNIAFHQINIERRIDIPADIKAIWRLFHLIKKNRYDIVVGHTPKGALVALTAAKLAGVRCRIYYRHGLIYTTACGSMRFVLKSVERFTGFCATHIVNVSPSLSKLAVDDKLNSPSKQTVIGLGTCGGIDTTRQFNPELLSNIDKFTLKSELGISDNELVVGFCGRICKDKGIMELIDGFRSFRHDHPDSKLLLVGDFDTRDILPTSYKHEILENKNIIITGLIDKNKISLYYSLMDIFVFPSYREGFGVSVIEASAMQIPILVSTSHGCVDSIREHITGEYIALDAHGVSEGLETMQDRIKRMHYGLNGRKWVVENFDQRKMWPQIANFYNSLKHETI